MSSNPQHASGSDRPIYDPRLQQPGGQPAVGPWHGQPGQPGQHGQHGQAGATPPAPAPGFYGGPAANWTPPPAKTGRPIKHFIGYPVAILMALMVGVGIGGSDSGSVTADPASSGSNAGSSPAASKAAAKPASKPAEKPAGAAGIGSPVRDGKFQFTVTKVKGGVKQVGDQYLNEKAQGQFVMVSVTIENIGDEPRTFDSSSQRLFDAAGKEYSADGEAGIYLEESNSFLNEINPGNTVKGVLVFDVPKSGFKPGKIELHDSAFSGGAEVALA